jgi:signal transduction histidine kinase/ActR/RegA family two-component response regulator
MGKDSSSRRVDSPPQAMRQERRVHQDEPADQKIAASRDAYARLEASNHELRREIRQREQAERALKEADQRKDQFLAMLGHELRNPLAPIRHAAEVLKIATPDDPAIQELVDVIERQSSHMSRIIDDLLDVSRISRGKITLHFETVDWRALVEDETHDFGVEFIDSGLTLQLDLPPKPVWVHGDSTRLTQVLGNLLSNAQKFSDRGGIVTVRLRADDERRLATLSVSDTGIGVELDMLGRMFDPFSQADRSLDRTRGGLGLGLALVRGLVALHGGEVTAASAGLGRGTTISVCLPVSSHSQISISVPQRQPRARRQRILVVDDRRDQLRMLEALLTRLGHEVHTASSGGEALRLATALHPDVVFSDIGLPDIDGYAIARRLRSDPELRNAFLVAVTGYGQPEDEQRAYEAGFDRHCRKPVGIAELQEVLGFTRPIWGARDPDRAGV